MQRVNVELSDCVFPRFLPVSQALSLEGVLSKDKQIMSKSTRNSGNAWTSTDRAALRQLANQNTPTRVMGLKLGRTAGAIAQQASQMGVSLKPTNQRPYG